MGNCQTKKVSVETQTEYEPTIDDIKNIKCLDVNDFGIDFIGIKGYARVDLVYDGDTATLVFWYKSMSKFIRTRIRMAHYDTAEMKGTSAIEKSFAINAKIEFEKLVNFKEGSGRRIKKENRYDSNSDIVWFEVIDMDTKWHRPIVMVWNTNNPKRSINAIIHEKWGVDYEGEHKSHDWNKERITNISYDRPMSTSL